MITHSCHPNNCMFASWDGVCHAPSDVKECPLVEEDQEAELMKEALYLAAPGGPAGFQERVQRHLLRLRAEQR